jgi:hypothetical protein
MRKIIVRQYIRCSEPRSLLNNTKVTESGKTSLYFVANKMLIYDDDGHTECAPKLKN